MSVREFLCTIARRIRPKAAPASQSNEQALIASLVRDLPVPRTFCEFGFDAHEFNCAQLITAGWRGLLIDGDAEKVARAQARFPERVIVRLHYLTLDTLFDIVTEHFPPDTLGVLSIDVDGNDYWFLGALLPLRPALIVCEYNASFLHRTLTVPYDAHFDRHAKHPRGFYHGASLSALTSLAAKHGYDLVAVSDGGLNAFFRRRDLRPDQAALDPVRAYKPSLLRAQYNDGMTPEQQWESVRDLPLLEI